MLDTKATKDRLSDLAADFKAYVELTQKSRTKLTKMDRRRIGELEQSLSFLTDPIERSDFLVSLDLAADFLNTPARTIGNWHKIKGMPKVKHGLYDLKVVTHWWVENIIGIESKKIEEIKLKYWTWKAEKEKIGVEQAKEELVAREDIAKSWAGRISEVSAALVGFIDRLPPLLVGKSRNEIRQVLDDEFHNLRERYSRDGRHCTSPVVSGGEGGVAASGTPKNQRMGRKISHPDRAGGRKRTAKAKAHTVPGAGNGHTPGP